MILDSRQDFLVWVFAQMWRTCEHTYIVIC